jgi:hypothetical protein
MSVDFTTIKKFRDVFVPQRGDRFLVSIIAKDIVPEKYTSQFAELKKQGGDALSCPKIDQYLVSNITLPTFEFEKEYQPNGILVKSYPVLKFEGFSFPILFQEDEFGTISRFINWCQKRIIHKSGQYYHPDISRIGDIVIEVIGWDNNPTMIYKLQKAYFLGATPITFDYSNATNLPISINFGADQMTFETKF